jgi:hypothetical protein
MRTVIIYGNATTLSQWTQIGWWLGGLAILAVALILFTAYMAEKEIRD